MTRTILKDSKLSTIMHIHFLGIAGLVMSSLACLAKAAGYEITGSDENAYPPATTALTQYQVNWIVGHKPDNLGTPDLVVLGNHIRHDNPELKAALDRKLAVISFPQFVQMMYSTSKDTIVPAGVHGKSTLTALIGWILVEAGHDPTVLIGAASRNFKSSFRKGAAELLLIEGDEYSSSCLDRTSKFMYYDPSIAIITNAELDHVDLLDTLEKQVATYTAFARSVRPGGLVLLCSDSPTVDLISREQMTAHVETYGLTNKPAWHATDLVLTPTESRFAIVHDKTRIADFLLTIPGTHNIQNATAAIATTLSMGVPLGMVKSALSTFLGVERRFEVIGEIDGITIVDDFAHHPTAIRMTLSAARAKYGERRLWCVYEPHTYSRVKALLADFAGAFQDADEVIVANIYAARERALAELVHPRDIVEVVQKDLRNVKYIPTPDLILAHLLANVQCKDVVVFMSVGRFGELSARLLMHLKEARATRV